MSVMLTFITSDGEHIAAEGQAGDSLLKVAQAAGMPLEGTCEGQMACSTCHVYVADQWHDRLPQPGEDEDDMLDLAFAVQRTSRLSCQIILDAKLDGLTVTIPSEAKDMSRI